MLSEIQRQRYLRLLWYKYTSLKVMPTSLGGFQTNNESTLVCDVSFCKEWIKYSTRRWKINFEIVRLCSLLKLFTCNRNSGLTISPTHVTGVVTIPIKEIVLFFFSFFFIRKYLSIINFIYIIFMKIFRLTEKIF